MCVLLFVCMLSECEGDSNAAVGDGEGACRACGWYTWFRYLSNAADVLGIYSVVRGMRGVGGACEMCMCLARGGVGGEGGKWMRGLGLPIRGEQGSIGRVFVLRWCRWVGGLDQGLDGWCYVYASCESGFFV